jgi:hypothetical protein
MKWEYLIVYVQDSKVAEDGTELDQFLDADTYTDKLNKYGDAGWELVAMNWTNDGARAAFKRPRQS